MILLSILKSQDVADELSDEAINLVIEAALHFIYFSSAVHNWPDSLKDTINQLKYALDKQNDFIKKTDKLLMKSENELDDRILTAFRCLFQARDKVSRDVHKSLLDKVIKESYDLCLKMVKLKDGYDGEFHFYLYVFLNKYRDYAILPCSSLAMALASWIRDQGTISNIQFPLVNLISSIDVGVPSDVGLIGAAFIANYTKTNLEGIEGFTERALILLDKADNASTIARECEIITEYINTVHISHLLYDTAKTSLNWIIDRYKKNGISPPNELYDELRVAEENRVESLSTLESYCGSLITTPITDAIGKSVISKRIVDSDGLKCALIDGTIRNPVYPNCFRELWNKIVDTISQNNHKLSFSPMERASELEKTARSLFADSFSDVIVSKKIKEMQELWYFNRLSYCKK